MNGGWHWRWQPHSRVASRYRPALPPRRWRLRFRSSFVGILLFGVACVGGGSVCVHKVSSGAPAAQSPPDVQRTPIPLSPLELEVPSQEVVRRNRSRLTRPTHRELLRNGGFEKSGEQDQQQVRPWRRTFWARKANDAEVAARAIVRTAQRTHRGDYALKIDAAFGNDDGGSFSISQVLPVEEIKGRRIRYELWNYLEAHPDPDLSPVTMRVRQWQGRDVVQHQSVQVVGERGRWRRGELVERVLERAERVDVTAAVANTHYSSRPTVVFLDDLSVTVMEDELLAVTLPAPEQAAEVGTLPIECRVAEQLSDHAPFSIAHVVRRGNASFGGARMDVDATVSRGVISLRTLEAGPYELVSILTLPELGPVATVRNNFLVYDGPFGQDR